MYKCQCCGAVASKGEPRQTHIIYREVPAILRSKDTDRASYIQGTRREVAQELQVCKLCKRLLEQGTSPAEIALMPSEAERRSAASKSNTLPLNQAIKLSDLKRRKSSLKVGGVNVPIR